MLKKISGKNIAKFVGLLGVSAVTLAVAPSSAHAIQLTNFTTSSAFSNATSGVTNIDFSGVTIPNNGSTGGGQYLYEGSAITQSGPNGGVTFGSVPTASGSSGLYVVSTTYDNGTGNNGFYTSGTTNPVQSLLDYTPGTYNSGITANVSGAVTGGVFAVGTDIGAIRGTDNSNFLITLTGTDGSTATYDLATSTTIPNSTFIGFTTNTAISSISFVATDNTYQTGTNNSAQVQISNFRLGTIAPGVPFETNSALGVAILGCFWSGNLLLKKMNKKEFTS